MSFEESVDAESAISTEYTVRYLDKTFWAGLFTGMFLFGIFTAAGIWITIRIPVALNDPAITYANVVLPQSGGYCAGETGVFTADVDIQADSLVQTYYSVVNPVTGSNIPDTQDRVGARIYPEARHFPNQAIPFPVPTILPPGDYVHVRATIAVNKDSEPSFISIPFRVRPCD